MKQSKRRSKRATGSGQLSLMPARSTAKRVVVSGDVRFLDPDPSLILVNNTPLEAMLVSMGNEFVLELRELIRSLDWSRFEENYRGGGRLPFHPALMMSLILFGTLNGHRSLRALQQFSATDIRCWWLSGGETPNYTTFAKFLTRHQAHISGGFFESLTAEILTRLKSSAQSVAIDGTVMEAAGSRLRTLTAEAAQLAADRARQQADNSDDDPGSVAKAKRAEHVAKIASEVAANQKYKGRPNQSGRVCGTEPEAPIRKLKAGGVAPSYVASIASNEERIVTGLAVDPSSETKVVEAIVDQTERCSHESVKQVLADAGYIGHAVLDFVVDRDIDLLCPEGRARGNDGWTKKDGGSHYPKSAFLYQDETDTYRCPAGQVLHRAEKYNARDGQPITVYRARSCAGCAEKQACTRAKNRAVKRYLSDGMKAAMRQVMSHPRARQRYRRRQTMVEPVFAELRYIQNLNRFARSGLPGATLEWALNCAAHNLRRYQKLTQAASALFHALFAACTATKTPHKILGPTNWPQPQF